MTEEQLSQMTTAEYHARNGKLASEGMAKKAARGEYPHAAPYGYRNVRLGDTILLEIDPDAARYVRMAFQLILRGHTIQQVADALNAAGARSKRGKMFSPATVHKILWNPTYSGTIRFKNIERAAKHVPIVASGLAAEVKRVLAERRC